MCEQDSKIAAEGIMLAGVLCSEITLVYVSSSTITIAAAQ